MPCCAAFAHIPGLSRHWWIGTDGRLMASGWSGGEGKRREVMRLPNWPEFEPQSPSPHWGLQEVSPLGAAVSHCIKRGVMSHPVPGPLGEVKSWGTILCTCGSPCIWWHPRARHPSVPCRKKEAIRYGRLSVRSPPQNKNDSLELLEGQRAGCDMQVMMSLILASVRINKNNKTQYLPVPGLQGLLFEHILFNSVCNLLESLLVVIWNWPTDTEGKERLKKEVDDSRLGMWSPHLRTGTWWGPGRLRCFVGGMAWFLI